jgi:ERCC4-type nuclease
MIIKIDNREHKLIKLLNVLNKEYKFDFKIIVERLDLGDLIILNDKNKELLMIERKSINDLASSIKDGRYSEQSLRLTNYPLHNHNIIYLLEGNIAGWSNKYMKMESKTLYVTMFCLQYYKGFSVVKTNDILETAEYILRFTDKIGREKTKPPFYSNTNTTNNAISPKRYCEVINKVKKKNITPKNIGEIILSQIPGISSTTSMAVMKKFGSLYNLLMALDNNPKCLDGMTYETKNKENRRISKTSIRNIVQYLLYQKSNIIKVDV